MVHHLRLVTDAKISQFAHIGSARNHHETSTTKHLPDHRLRPSASGLFHGLLTGRETRDWESQDRSIMPLPTEAEALDVLALDLVAQDHVVCFA